MTYFIYGNDSYRIKKTADAIVEKYQESSDMNSTLFDGDYDIEKIRSDVMSVPFLAKKRLVVIKNIFSAKGVDTKKIVDILDKKPESTVILFVENGQPDKRSTLFKRLLKEKSKELNLIEGAELVRWIKAETERLGGRIETKEANILASYYSGDLWKLKNELQKLVNFNKEITEESLDNLSVSNITAKIFDFTDAITQKKREKSFSVLKDLLDSGENELYILSMIQWQMRNLALIYDLRHLGEREIASILKINPFVVKKNIYAAKKVDSEETIRNYYRLIVETENDIKTGGKEPDVALELLVNKLTV